MSEIIVIQETTEVVEVNTPGVPGPSGNDGEGVPTGGTAGQVLTKQSGTDFDTDWEDPGAASTPALTDLTDVTGGAPQSGEAPVWDGDSFELTNVATQAELDALSSVYQPLDSDLTAVAALTTTAFGRGLLELANQAALLSAAGAAAASHAHAGEDITSGTVADARIASTIARDSEVTAAIATALAAADGAGLSDNGSGVLAVNVDDSTIEISSDALRVKDGGITTAKLSFDPATQAELDALSSVYQPLDSDLTALAALTTTAFGRGLLELANAAALLSAAGAQASDADLTAIAGLSPSNDDVIQRKAGAWTNRTLAQLIADLAALGTTFQPLDSDLTAIAALATNAAGRGLLTLADPGADRIVFWDDSAGAFTHLEVGDNLTITDTTLDATGGGSLDVEDESLIVSMEVYA